MRYLHRGPRWRMRVPCDVSGKWQPDVQGCCWSFLSSKWILKLIITATFWSKTAKVADALFRWRNPTLIFYLPRWMKTLKSLAILLLQVTSYYSPLKGGILKDRTLQGSLLALSSTKTCLWILFFSNWLMFVLIVFVTLDILQRSLQWLHISVTESCVVVSAVMTMFGTEY